MKKALLSTVTHGTENLILRKGINTILVSRNCSTYEVCTE